MQKFTCRQLITALAFGKTQMYLAIDVENLFQFTRKARPTI
jgi:hypothetical protein